MSNSSRSHLSDDLFACSNMEMVTTAVSDRASVFFKTFPRSRGDLATRPSLWVRAFAGMT